MLHFHRFVSERSLVVILLDISRTKTLGVNAKCVIVEFGDSAVAGWREEDFPSSQSQKRCVASLAELANRSNFAKFYHSTHNDMFDSASRPVWKFSLKNVEIESIVFVLGV